MAGVIDGRTLQGPTFSTPFGTNVGLSTGSFRGNVGDFTSANVSPGSFLGNPLSGLSPGTGGSVFGPMNSQPGLPGGSFQPTNTFGQPINQGGQQGGGKKKDNPPDADERGTQIKRRAKKERAKELLKPPKPDNRVKSVTSNEPSQYMGIKDMAQEGGSGSNAADSFLSDDLEKVLQGMIQNVASQMPAMQQVMNMVSDGNFNQLLGNLPSALQSLLPVGTIAGAGLGTEQMGNSISVQQLMQLASGNPDMMAAIQSIVGSSGGASGIQGIANMNQVGLPQNITADLARSLFNPSQLASLLPGNLQNLLPQVAPLIQNGAGNTMDAIANAAPQQVPQSNEPGGGNGNKNCKTNDPLNDGKVNENTRAIDYTQMLSKNFSLHDLTIGSGVEGGKNMLNGDDIPKIVKNLSGLSTNVLEPLRDKYPGFSILSGWRQEGEGHKDGKAVDVAWGVGPAKMAEIAEYVQKSIPAAQVKIMNQKIHWLHITYEEGKCGAQGSTQTPDGQSTSALVDYYSNNHKFI